MSEDFRVHWEDQYGKTYSDWMTYEVAQDYYNKLHDGIKKSAHIEQRATEPQVAIPMSKYILLVRKARQADLFIKACASVTHYPLSLAECAAEGCDAMVVWDRTGGPNATFNCRHIEECSVKFSKICKSYCDRHTANFVEVLDGLSCCPNCLNAPELGGSRVNRVGDLITAVTSDPGRE